MPKTGAERQAAYRKRHPERTKEALIKYKQENPEKIKEISRRSYAKRKKEQPEKWLYKLAKERAAKQGLDFNIELEDVVIPDLCPVLRIPLIIGDKGFNDPSPTLDRVDNTKGYVKGNVAVISWRANRIKCDATLEEIAAILIYMEKNKMKNGKWRA